MTETNATADLTFSGWMYRDARIEDDPKPLYLIIILRSKIV